MKELTDLFDDEVDTTSSGLKQQGDMEASISQVLPTLSAGESPSLLSPDTLRALVKESELSEEVMAASFLMQAAPQMHTVRSHSILKWSKSAILWAMRPFGLTPQRE